MGGRHPTGMLSCFRILLPPAMKLEQGNIFRSVGQEFYPQWGRGQVWQGGHAWQGGLAWQGVCMAGGGTWQGACVVGGHVWQGA